MAHEVELKLALAEDEQRNFMRHPLLKQASGKQTFRLVNLYYDTPRFDLRQRGIGLRLRAKGNDWLQTVKCAGQSAGGLSSRPEWETPYSGHFEFSHIDHRKVRKWLERPKLKAAITPIFETNFQRVSWFFEPQPGTRIVMVLDRGWIAANGRRDAISEIEIELLEGDESCLFDLAQSLATRITLSTAPLSKAERGYRLFSHIAVAPVKAAPLDYAANLTPLEAFRHIAWACLDHMQHNHAGIINSDDPEYIHQMRVATRRLRALMRLFAPILPDSFSASVLPILRELMNVLGYARDLDVLLSEIAEPVLNALPDEPRLAALVGVITEQRFNARQAALQFLNAPQHGSNILQVLAALHALNPDEPATGTDTESADLSLLQFAENRLRSLRKKVLTLAAAASTDDPTSLHVLRIAIKRLRYALEFFAPLTADKARRQLLGHLVTLQDALGQINDLANAGALLMNCAGEDARLRESVTLIGGWHGPRHHDLLKSVPVGLKHLGKLRLPKCQS